MTCPPFWYTIYNIFQLYIIMDIEYVLCEYGLTDKEIKVYITLLPLGLVTLQEVSSKIDLPRTTVYNTLSYLSNKGLVSNILKDKVKHYQAVDPNKLIDNVNNLKHLVSSILPDLKKIKNNEFNSSSAQIFQGTKGLTTILTDIFEHNQMIYYFGSYSLSKELLKHQPDHFRTIRLDRHIPAKIIIEPYAEPSFNTKEYKKITDMRFSNIMKEFPCMIFIYGDKLAMYTLEKDIIGVIINNSEISKAMKIVFDMFWKQSELKLFTKDIKR